MDECTHNVRAEYWKNIISQCQQRPAQLISLQSNGLIRMEFVNKATTIGSESSANRHLIR